MENYNMDILRFINSKDIREYLKTINYEFNSLEAAWLIYQCRNATIEEKHAAWRELINTMPDCEIKQAAICRHSLHSFLNEFLKTENKILNEFFNNTENSIYSYEWWEDNMWHPRNPYCSNYEDILASYDSLEKCFSKNGVYSTEYERPEKYRIIKQELNNGTIITVIFSKDNKVINYSFGFSPSNNEYLYDESVLFTFDNLYFNFPTPFKKGDILCIQYEQSDIPRHLHRGPFVLTELCTENTMLQKILRPFEMVASGIFQNENRLIYEAPTTNYMDLEYYRCELDGKKQILKAFRDFYMNKLNVIDLTNTYHLTLTQENTNDIEYFVKNNKKSDKEACCEQP